ncbi:MAG TPA: BON domain-containing protein, partial [Smithellaceae bacterium]|nr:BON domain-containing protein [Smithellaceae bacterium]
PPENAVPAPEIDLPRLEGQINRALREAGIDGVTAQVNDAAVVTLKGVVQSVKDQQKALEIVRTFKGVSQLNDIIFIVEK